MSEPEGDSKRRIRITATAEVLIPTLPNYVRSPDGSLCFDVADLTDSDLQALGDEWTNALIAWARLRRSLRAVPTDSVPSPEGAP